MDNRIYLDNAATTPISASVYSNMLSCMQEVYGNSSSLHSFGREAMATLENARETIAKSIGAKASEIIFTSGGTESNNLAIKGFAYANKDKGNHIIVSSIEHASILEACKDLEADGFDVTYLDVNEQGFVSSEDLIKAIREDTILISIMFANNEIGTIQDIKALSSIAKEKGISEYQMYIDDKSHSYTVKFRKYLE